MNQPQNDFFFGLLLLIMLAAAGVALLHLTSHHRERMIWQIRIFLIALGVRFFVSIVIYEFGLVYILGDEDSSGWYGGVVLLNSWISNHVGWLDLPGVLSEAFSVKGGHQAGY